MLVICCASTADKGLGGKRGLEGGARIREGSQRSGRGPNDQGGVPRGVNFGGGGGPGAISKLS